MLTSWLVQREAGEAHDSNQKVLSEKQKTLHSLFAELQIHKKDCLGLHGNRLTLVMKNGHHHPGGTVDG